jgi:hypothetical protein
MCALCGACLTAGRHPHRKIELQKGAIIRRLYPTPGLAGYWQRDVPTLLDGAFMVHFELCLISYGAIRHSISFSAEPSAQLRLALGSVY